MKPSDPSSNPGFGAGTKKNAESGRGGAQFSAADLSAVIAAGPEQHQCANCGTEIRSGATVCAGCGIRLHTSARRIRCRHCRHQASSHLVICPNCGRHLQPAPSRLLTWGVPLLLALLIGVLLFDRLDVRIQVGGGNQPQTVTLGEMVELPLVSTQTPIPEATAEPIATTPVAVQEVITVATVVEAPTATATPEPSATASPTATATQTPIPTATPTVTPTSAPTLDATSYTIQSGDTPAGIARRFGVTVDELLAANDLTLADATRIRAGTVLVIPAGGDLSPTPTSAAPPTATPSPAPAVAYTLQAGDTLVGIAQRFGITVNNLLAANGLTAQDAPTLQVGTVMVIPAAGQSFPTPTPTLAPATPAPAPVQASPTPTPTQPPTQRLSAPVLLSPSSGTPILGCDLLQIFTWEAASLEPGDEYELRVGYISGPPQADGSETISWVAFVHQTQSSWKLDTALCTQAPQEFNRQWRWYVQVFNGSNAVSPPSSVWAFSWNP